MHLIDYLAITPTVSASIIAVFAIIITFKPPSTMKSKGCWLFVIIFFTLIAIAAVIWQQSIVSNNAKIASEKEDKKISQEAADKAAQKEREDHIQNSVSYLQGQISALVVTSGKKPNDPNIKKLMFSLDSIKSQLNDINEPNLPLKQRALNLYQQLNKFMRDREKKAPRSTSRETVNERMEYEIQTGELCALRFQNQPLDMYKVLSKATNHPVDNSFVPEDHSTFTTNLLMQNILSMAKELP